MYSSYLLNKYGLFQRVYGWKKSPDIPEACSNEISALLYRASSCLVSIERTRELNKICVDEFNLFKDQLNLTDDRVVFYSTNIISLINEVSPLLSSLRIMQDMILLILSKNLHISLPMSIEDVIKKPDAHDIPEGIKDIINKYWNSGGDMLRQYRHIDQHHTILIDHIFMQVEPTTKILVLFPDNPEVVSPKEFTYNESIDGLKFMESAFFHLNEVYENIAELLGYETKKLELEIGMNQLGELRPFRNRTLAFAYIEQLDAKKLKITGLRIGQNDQGMIEAQRLELGEEKLNEAKKLYGINK